jgi:hypothetical protein
MSEKIKVIIDHIGRTVVGKQVDETDTTLTLRNPIILHVQPNQSQLQVQSFPYIFMELLSPDFKTSNDWTFQRGSIVDSSVQLAEGIIKQYEAFNSPQPVQESDTPVIKLFED